MNTTMRRAILRANAIWLIVASTGGLFADLAGAFFGKGPQGPILSSMPDVAIGFVEAHGLAFIIGVLLWFARPRRAWHLTGAAVHFLLGASNLVFWQLFITANMLPAGYVATTLHAAFFLIHLIAAAVTGQRRDTCTTCVRHAFS